MADNQQQYEADEFDQLAAERQTYGAHRVHRRKYGWIIALVAILIIAPVAGVLGGQLLTQSDKAQELITQSESKKSDSQKDQDTEKSEAEKSAESAQTDDQAAAEQGEAESDDATAAAESADAQEQPSAPEAAPTPEPEPVINQAAPVSVLNAAGVQGLAREKAQVLRNAGFTQVVADNYRGNRIAQSTVYYADAATADTANKVAANLGISLVQENANIARPGGIVVILATR